VFLVVVELIDADRREPHDPRIVQVVAVLVRDYGKAGCPIYFGSLKERIRHFPISGGRCDQHDRIDCQDVVQPYQLLLAFSCLASCDIKAVTQFSNQIYDCVAGRDQRTADILLLISIRNPGLLDGRNTRPICDPGADVAVDLLDPVNGQGCVMEGNAAEDILPIGYRHRKGNIRALCP